MTLNRSLFIFLILSILILHIHSQSAEEDLVILPDTVYTGHRWYSGTYYFIQGYLTIPMGKFHYVFFQSQRDPKNDPVLLWLNGGPGCSSLIGMFYENGPFTFKEGTTTLQLNKHSWNNKANVLYITSPGRVGFSHGSRNDNNTDQTVADDNLQALIAFFKKFPTYKSNPFYIAGESYAGVYVPYLAYEIIKYNKLPSRQLTFTFKGIMVGNACTDPRECYQPGGDANISIYQYEFLYKHGFYTEQQYDHIVGACMLGYHGGPCNKIRDEMDTKFGKTNTSLLNIYAQCHYSQPSSEKKYKITQSGKKLDLADFVDCDDHVGIDHFLNLPLMHEYLHVDPIHFEMCNAIVADKYQIGENQSYWLYPLLIKQNIRIWVISGDLDADVPITGTLTWLKRLREDYHLPIQEPWRQWWVPGITDHDYQVGGMSWTLRGLTFASVKGAGHMVPKDQKKAAFVLVDSFLNGLKLPFKGQSRV